MYESFYGLSEKPFNLTPDPDFLYMSNSHKKAMTYLKYGIESKEGFIQLSGEIGSGKTTLLRGLLRGLDREIKAAYIVNPRGTFRQILRTLLDKLNVVPFRLEYSKERLLNKFHEFLKGQTSLDHPVILIFDEAQNLDISTLEELRMLSNYETDKHKLVQIILVGQPELRDKLDRPELVQLRQRIAVRCHLGPLSSQETQAYIDHRLKVAGSNGSIKFGPEACQAIQKYSHGIPRLINVACNNVMLAGYVEEKKAFDGPMAQRVISEMHADDGRAEPPLPVAAEPEPAKEPELPAPEPEEAAAPEPPAPEPPPEPEPPDTEPVAPEVMASEAVAAGSVAPGPPAPEPPPPPSAQAVTPSTGLSIRKLLIWAAVIAGGAVLTTVLVALTIKILKKLW